MTHTAATGGHSHSPARICPRCGAGQIINVGEAIWPADYCCSFCSYAIQSVDGVPLFAPELADTISGFDPESFGLLADVEDHHFWFVPRNRLLAGLLDRFFPDAMRIMEIGCGNATVLSAFAKSVRPRTLVGSELHPTGLEIARRRLGNSAQFVQMDARRIPAEGVFDVIGAFDVIEHIAEDELVIQQMYRALKSGGGAMIAVPQHPWLWSAADEVAFHVRRYRRGEMEHKLRNNGFRILFSGSYCATLLPLLLASRWTERLTRKKGNAPQASEIEAMPPSAVNRLLRAALQIEVTATLGGFRFPVGGSRVIVAERID